MAYLKNVNIEVLSLAETVPNRAKCRSGEGWLVFKRFLLMDTIKYIWTILPLYWNTWLLIHVLDIMCGFPLLIPTWYTIFYINYIKLSLSLCNLYKKIVYQFSVNKGIILRCTA